MFIPINSWRVRNKHLAIKIMRYPRWSIHQVSTNYNIPEMIHRIGMRRLRDLQESGGVSSWTIPVQSIILHSFSLYEFTFQVLIKVFNEVVSTWDHMSYFLFSPPGFLGKYTRHIYCHLNSMDTLHIELTEAIIIICWIIFSLFSHWVWRSFNNISYTIPHFSHRVLEDSSHFSHWVFGGDCFKMMKIHKDKHRLGGVLEFN